MKLHLPIIGRSKPRRDDSTEQLTKFPVDPNELAVRLAQRLDQVIAQNDKQTNTIIGVFIISLVVLIVMGITLLIDSFHFNSATYKEYSTRLQSNEQLLESNRQIMEQGERRQGEILKTLEAVRTDIERINRKQ